jgi:hypothetical protein
MVATLIVLLIVTVILVPAVVVLAIGRVNDERRRHRVEAAETDGELPELLRRPLRAGRAS